ncbi:hypothetical protein [Paenibacillus turpanensis]|uniref:hypothetical protein n=1 Tax=Paenibacillus turpanensis TaxID=2689078 RepID=UPI00140E2CCF|nr:hypothetical protein [Paenibacillus turpanensis]
MEQEFTLELCFVHPAESEGVLENQVRGELGRLFAGHYQYITSKREQELDIVLAEVRGKGAWNDEEQLLDYFEQNADLELLDTVSGFRLEVLKGKKGCSCCERG